MNKSVCSRKLTHRLLSWSCSLLLLSGAFSQNIYAAPIVVESKLSWNYEGCALMKAIQENDPVLVKSILTSGQLEGLLFETGYLDAAIYQGNIKIIKFLLEAGFQLGEHSFLCAFEGKEKKPEVIRYLLELDVNIDVECEDTTPLILAVMHNYMPSVKQLLSAGANLEIGEGHKGTALTRAVQCRNLEAAKLLLKHGANLEARNHKSFTPIMIAALYKDPEMMQLLQKSEADLHARTTKDVTEKFPIFIAKGSNVFDIARLVENPEIKKAFRHCWLLSMQKAIEKCATPLIIDVQSIKSLAASGVDIQQKDEDGGTALLYAVLNENIEAVQVLIELGANVDEKYFFGLTPLMIATMYTNESIVQLLLSAKADANAMTSEEALFTLEHVFLIPEGSTAADIMQQLENPCLFYDNPCLSEESKENHENASSGVMVEVQPEEEEDLPVSEDPLFVEETKESSMESSMPIVEPMAEIQSTNGFSHEVCGE
jgi:ankyrin repeat protein